jgi:hypothetical protein
MRKRVLTTAARTRKVLRRIPPPPAPLPAPDATHASLRPLDWAEAVHTAESRIAERLPLSDTADYPVRSEIAQRLASLVIAYGRLDEEVRRQVTRNEPPAGAEPAPVEAADAD